MNDRDVISRMLFRERSQGDSLVSIFPLSLSLARSRSLSPSLSRSLSFLFSIARRSRPDEIPGPDPVSGSFSSPPRPCVAEHALAITWHDHESRRTHFHVARLVGPGPSFSPSVFPPSSSCLTTSRPSVPRRFRFASPLISFRGNRSRSW